MLVNNLKIPTIRYLLKKKLLIVLSNTRTTNLSLFLANSLFGIVVKKKRAKHTPRVLQASGNPRRYLKRGRAFRLAAFQRNFASTRSTKVYAQENLFIYFFLFCEPPRNIPSTKTRVSLYESEEMQKEGRILNYHARKKNVVPFGFSASDQ